MPDNRVNVRYTVQEVNSAQRMRLMRSGQLKILLFFGTATVIFFALHVLFPQIFRFVGGLTWGLVAQMALIYFISIMALIFVVPWISFHLTRFWKLPLVFHFGQKGLRLNVEGKSAGLRLAWDQVRQIEENRLVFLIYYDDGQKHFILPKAGFSEAAEGRFRQLVSRHVQGGTAERLPAAQQPAEEEQEEEASP